MVSNSNILTKHYRFDTFPNIDKVKIEQDENKIVLDLEDLKQCHSIQTLDIIFNFQSENNETAEVIYKKDLDLFDFSKQIIPTTIKNNHNNNGTTLNIFLHIKGENNQNSFNLTLIDNVIWKRNQDGTLTFTITKPEVEVENLTTMKTTTILGNSHINTNNVEGTAIKLNGIQERKSLLEYQNANFSLFLVLKTC